MSDQMIAAITGAICGGLVSGIIGLIKYISEKRSLKKAMRVGLYFEIEHHDITFLQNDNDGQPNFLLSGFQNHFYINNLSTIVKMLEADTIMVMAFYYSKLSLAKEWQDELFKINEQLHNLTSKLTHTEGDKEKIKRLVKNNNAIKGLLRTTIAPCINSREKLLNALIKGLPKDPSGIKFIDVPLEYQEWWKNKITNKIK